MAGKLLLLLLLLLLLVLLLLLLLLLCACCLLPFQPPLLRLPTVDWVWVAAQTRAFSTSNLTQNSTHRAPEQGWWFHSKRVGAADSGPPCVIGACLHAHAHRPPWTHYW